MTDNKTQEPDSDEECVICGDEAYEYYCDKHREEIEKEDEQDEKPPVHIITEIKRLKNQIIQKFSKKLI
jgi:hypothetical protein